MTDVADSPGRGKTIDAVMVGAAYVFLSSTYFSIAVNSLALGLMAVSWALLMVTERRWSVRATPLDGFFLAYVAAELLATAFSTERAQSLLFSKRLLLIGIVYFLASRIESVAAAKRAVAVLLGSAGVVGALGVAKLVLGNPEENTRLGIFQFYMTTSEIMMIALLLTLPFVLHRGTPLRVRLAAAAVLVPVAIALYATVTRGAYLAAAAGIIFIALVRNRKLLIPLVVLVVALFLFAPPYVESRLQSIIDLNHPENVSRLMMWKAGLRIFADHPVVGVGDIDLGDLLHRYAEPGYPGGWGHLHNVGLQILVTLGVVGAAAFVALFVRIAITEWRIYRAVRDDWFTGSFVLGALAVFVGFLVNGLTEWSFGDQEVVILLWISVGLSLAIGNLFPSPKARGDR